MCAPSNTVQYVLDSWETASQTDSRSVYQLLYSVGVYLKLVRAILVPHPAHCGFLTIKRYTNPRTHSLMPTAVIIEIFWYKYFIHALTAVIFEGLLCSASCRISCRGVQRWPTCSSRPIYICQSGPTNSQAILYTVTQTYVTIYLILCSTCFTF